MPPITQQPSPTPSTITMLRTLPHLSRPLCTIRYPGAPNAPYTPSPTMHHFSDSPPIPIFRTIDTNGKPLPDAKDHAASLGQERCITLYETMLRLRAMDTVLHDAQRQGRISFYMRSLGEEAAVIGCAAALDRSDLVFSQYREHGVLLYRGAGYEYFCNQCMGNEKDLSGGRQMPMHFGDRERKFHMVSSPLATQLPHAVGAGYGVKMRGVGGVTVGFFGEGAASEGDFAAALQFAGVLGTPTLFLCRNNGYAISTKVGEQYAGDGIAGRAGGYGVAAMRVDGGDLFATIETVGMARLVAEREGRAVLVEILTYRGADHSTSDDGSRYREEGELTRFGMVDGVERMKRGLVGRGWWDEERERRFVEEERGKVVEALIAAEKVEKPGVDCMFEHVYKEKVSHLQRQEIELRRCLRGMDDVKS